ncbi:MAG: hypothetical protein LBH40_05350 [Alphaproteobacteria bacterium]|jgi:hypothetical protein|nr:hypothetical protein [Alphaproteobacteria bacterium]
MLEQKIIEKIKNIFGDVDVFFNVEDTTSTNKLAILVSSFEANPINNTKNIETYFISAIFYFPTVSNNGCSIDVVFNRLIEYNQNNEDKVNFVYPYSFSDGIELNLEFIVDIDIPKSDNNHPMIDAEINVVV